MTLVEFLQTSNGVIGLLLGVFGIASAVIVWVHRRMKAVADKPVSTLNGKITEIENDLGRVSLEIKGVKKDVHTMGQRVQGVERSMETVARTSDLHRVQLELAALNGTVTSEMRMLSGMMHSFRESAIRAAEKDK